MEQSQEGCQGAGAKVSPKSRHSTPFAVPHVSALMSGRYEDYVDHKYKEYLKNQGKVDSVGTPQASVHGWR